MNFYVTRTTDDIVVLKLQQPEIKEKYANAFWSNNVVSYIPGIQGGCLWADWAVTKQSKGRVTLQIKMLHCAYYSCQDA